MRHLHPGRDHCCCQQGISGPTCEERLVSPAIVAKKARTDSKHRSICEDCCWLVQEARTDADKAKAPGAAGPGQLEALWQTVAEGDLFQSASHERKHLGFQLFSILLPHLRSAFVNRNTRTPGVGAIRPCHMPCSPQRVCFPSARCLPCGK